ncbi:MAG TPA: TIGR02281 family clan AA aspartic protease [Hyphomicrobiaceae bacterium]|nr:TIGR02281 family clan AA aspartic protease [Hyphomicrobiaceae bacterium]
MMLWLVILLIALGGAFFAFQADPELAASMMNVDTGAIVVALALAIYVAILFTTNRGPFMRTVRHLAIWAGLMLALIVGYSYRNEVGSVANRVVASLMPPGAGVTIQTGIPGERAVRIRKRRDGHFTATATVNGTAMTLMVDTGASTVVLKPADAAKAGIDVANLTYSMAVRTANGTTYAAPVRLEAISIGPILVKDVEALVAKPGNLNESLLGMSFLRRLRSFDFSGEYVTLRG